MKVVEKIKEPIYEEMELFEKKFSKSMSSHVSLLNRITHFIVNRKGKQMRPMFVFLVAKMMGNGRVNERSFRGAAVIELIHTATLVHDDVVDDSNERRGFFSINALWKNKIAVLVGDYLLSKGLLLSIENEDFDLLKIISIAVREMSQGELMQIEKARNLDITEDIYTIGYVANHLINAKKDDFFSIEEEEETKSSIQDLCNRIRLICEVKRLLTKKIKTPSLSRDL